MSDGDILFNINIQENDSSKKKYKKTAVVVN